MFRTKNDEGRFLTVTEENTPRRGIRRRQNGLPPELRLIDLDDENNEVEVRSLDVSRHESLSSSDYHLSSVFLPASKASSKGRGAFSSLGDGLWDIGVNATKLFGSGESVLSGSSGGEGTIAATTGVATPKAASTVPVLSSHPNFDAAGQKIFVATPFECLLAVRRDIADRFQWLIDQKAFENAWQLLNSHPEIAPVSEGAQAASRDFAGDIPDKGLFDPHSDDQSIRTVTSSDVPRATALDRERERLGNLWVQYLVSLDQWLSAGDTAGKVLENTASWEYWARRFVEVKKFDEIAYQLPTTPLTPPLASSLYNDVLNHYLHHDKHRMKSLLMQWHPDVFNVPEAIHEIQSSSELTNTRVKKRENEGWLLCQDALALLYVADGRPSDAIHCFIETRNADAALSLIHEHNLLNTITDKVYDFTLLRVTADQLASAPISKLGELTAEPVSLLAAAALQDILPVKSVVEQFQTHPGTGDLLLYFYFRTLWHGSLPSAIDDPDSEKIDLQSRPRFEPSKPIATSKTRHLLAPFGDLAIDLFAEYARDILSELLRSGDATSGSVGDQGIPYNYDHAVTVCEARRYIPELVHLLAITGQTRRALTLIIGELGDVAQAIKFVRDVADDGLWNDLSEFCLAKPHLIRRLLENIDVDISSEQNGINPKDFVERIPNDLAIDGLRDALSRLVHENDVQHSVASGASTVLRNEVAVVLNSLTSGRAKGMLFEAASAEATSTCAICETTFASPEDGSESNDDALVGYSCMHRYHLPCLLDALTTDGNKAQLNRARRQLLQSYMDERDSGTVSWRAVGQVGSKMTRARMVAGFLEGQSCIACRQSEVETVSTSSLDNGE